MGKQGKKARAKARSERKSGDDDGDGVGGGVAKPPPPAEAPPPDGLDLPDLPAPPTHAPGDEGGGAGRGAEKKRDPNALPRRPALPDDPATRRSVEPADVAALPLAANEVWQLLLADGFLLVGDATDALWGAGQGMRPLLAGPLPDLTSPSGWKELAGLLLGAMARPRDGEEDPRRPARVLVDPSFPPGTVESIRAEVRAADVRAEGGSPDDVLAAVTDVLYVPSLDRCSWGASARGPYGTFGPEGGANMLLTWALCLPRREDETWTCGAFLVDEGPGAGPRPHLVVERVHEGPEELPEERNEELLVGGGPVPLALVHHALLAVMLCPMDGAKRRPGKVVFAPDLAGQLGSYQGTMKEVGVEVLLGTG